MKERYCPSKKPVGDHDKECYYHGYETKCPVCGTPTWECKVGDPRELKSRGDYDILGDVQHRGTNALAPGGYITAEELPYAYARDIPAEEIFVMKQKGRYHK